MRMFSTITFSRLLRHIPVDATRFYDLAVPIVVLCGAILTGLLLHKMLSIILYRWNRQRAIGKKGVTLHLEFLKSPLRALIPSLCVAVAAPIMKFPGFFGVFTAHLLDLWIIWAIAWLAIKTASVIREAVMIRYRMDVPDNFRARRMYTQIKVIENIVIVIIVLIAVSEMLIIFGKVRQIGVSILASAGIAGLAVGFAAQKTLANLLAGIQIAIAQPIRIGDAVVIENEMGTIEEITLTYVTIRIWDLRQLVVPISYFLEKPIQNWTRTTTNLLGSVFIQTDYTVPVGEIRKELERILNANPLWDKKAGSLQVSDSTAHAVELRALVSAENATKLWDLRCAVREQLIEFLQKRFPWSLPRERIELEDAKRVAEKG
jgi:small-conductance mechanosensitive channel